MTNIAQDLFLLTTQLLNIKSKDLLIQLFIESINDIFPDHSFTWVNSAERFPGCQLTVSARTKTYGSICYSNESAFEEMPYALLQNAVQVLAIAIEKMEQDQFIADQKLHLQNLVVEKIQDYAALNEEYQRINEEYCIINEDLIEGNHRLGESEKRYRSISRLSSDFSYSCISLNGSFQVDWISDAFFTMTGYSNEELEEQGCWLFAAHPDDRTGIVKKFNSLKIGDHFKDEFRLVSKTGAIRTIINRIECIEDNQVQGGKRFYGSVIDITERKVAEQTIQLKAAELERFNRLMIGRELKMIELKKEINDLLKNAGAPAKYKIHEPGAGE